MNASIIGVGNTKIGKLNPISINALLKEALDKALADAKIKIRELEGLIVCPALSEPKFMAAHDFANYLQISENLKFCSSIDTGGASPVSALILAKRLVETKVLRKIAIVAGDYILSLGTKALLEKAGRSINHPQYQDFTKPVIPILYDRVADWHMKTYGTTREQLAMVSVLMSRQAAKHPGAMNRKELTVEEVLNSKGVASVTNVLECARPADGAGAIIVSSSENGGIFITGGAEGTGLCYPPAEISEKIFSAKKTARTALEESGISNIGSVKYFGIYDCFPICFIKFVEDAEIAMEGCGGYWVECMMKYTTEGYKLPVNTHGGLLSFGAPWEAPAIFSIIEAVLQMRGVCEKRQLREASPALIYGNGGIFTSSAVAILSKTERK